MKWAWIILLLGCGASEKLKQDTVIFEDYTTCRGEAKLAVASATTCREAITSLLDVMSQDRCKGFDTRAVDGGVNIGGYTYVCEESDGGH